MPPVTFTHLIWTWCAAREHRDTALGPAFGAVHQDCVDAFGLGLDKPPHPEPELADWMHVRVLDLVDGPEQYRSRTAGWHDHVHRLALHVADAANTGGNPFSSYLEAPLVIIAAYERYHQVLLPEHGHDGRAAAFALLVDLFAALHPDAANQVH